jgi:hypothetical protein
MFPPLPFALLDPRLSHEEVKVFPAAAQSAIILRQGLGDQPDLQ